MTVSVFDKRPPYVRFEEREMGLNAEATEKEGRPIPRVVVMACITPHGSKDVHEKIAEEWLAQIKRQALAGDYPPEWLAHFELQFKEWQRGNELPREGTPIKTWQMCTREAATRLIGNGITTVEDLAQFPDTGLGAIGMDGRYLRDMARGWIKEAKELGANAKALADANVKIEQQQETIARLTERVDRLAARLEEQETETPRRGRGRKDEAA
jgi:hypothetical protein